jgi:hypothetical protein
MSTYDHEGRLNPDRNVVTRDAEGSSNLKQLMQLMLDKLSDDNFAGFMQEFGGKLVAMVGTGGNNFAQDAKLRNLIREAQQGKLAAFKKSIGDDRSMRQINGPRTA